MEKLIAINERGKSHIYDEIPCEDAIYVNEEKGVFLAADGVSNSRYGGEGANAIVKGLGAAICEGDSLFEKTSFEIKEILCDAIKMIGEALVKKYGAKDKGDFACTLLGCVESEEELILFHCGDGVVLALPEAQSSVATIVSYPDNSASGAVYSAYNDLQRTRMRVIRLKKENYCGVMLATDGFADAFLVNNINFQGRRATEYFSMTKEEIYSSIEEIHYRECMITDDISCIIHNFNSTCEKQTEAHTPDTASPSESWEKALKTKSVDISYSEHSETASEKSKKGKLILPVLCALVLIAAIIVAIGMGVKNSQLNEKNKELQSVVSSQALELEKEAESVTEAVAIPAETESETEAGESTSADASQTQEESAAQIGQ